MRLSQLGLAALAALGLLAPVAYSRAQAPSYADLYNPLNVFNLSLEMDPADWAAVQADSSLSTEKPAWLYADGESKLLVGIRRKSESVVGDKISLKIDINEYFDENSWHGVKKLSLENGFDTDVISEGLAWYMHRAAETLPGDSYVSGHAAWVNVRMNGSPLGVYASVEQVDKRFLRNRDLWSGGNTWLYKGTRNGPHLLEEGPSAFSPAAQALNFSPFNNSNTPPPVGYESQLDAMIDMKGMLGLGAVNAFTGNADELFNRGHNFFFADFAGEVAGGKRRYFPWDLDAVLTNADASIYGPVHEFQDYITENPQFRNDYNQIMLDLLSGPLSVQSLHDFINELEPMLTPYLLADPNSNIPDVAGRFDVIRGWISLRHANVMQQVQTDLAAANRAAVPEPAGITIVGALGACFMIRRSRGHEGGLPSAR